MTELDRRSSLQKTTRRLSLRRDTQPQHLNREGSDCGCFGQKSHQSRDLPPAQNPAHGFPGSFQKNGLGCFATVLVGLHLKFSLWFFLPRQI